jgi:hypothetical protein
MKARMDSAGVDSHAFKDAALDGISITRRDGSVSARKAATKLLNPAGVGKDLTKSLAREAFRQRNELRAALHEGPPPPSVSIDDEFFEEMIDWIIGESGFEDTSDVRTRVAHRIYDLGIEATAHTVLSPTDYEFFHDRFGTGEIELTESALALTAYEPRAHEPLISRLDDLRVSVTGPHDNPAVGGL